MQGDQEAKDASNPEKAHSSPVGGISKPSYLEGDLSHVEDDGQFINLLEVSSHLAPGLPWRSSCQNVCSCLDLRLRMAVWEDTSAEHVSRWS